MASKILSIKSPVFNQKWRAWLQETKELLIEIRESGWAGHYLYEYHNDAETISLRLLGLRPKTRVIILKNIQLPLRGKVDPEFIKKAYDLIPAGAEYLLLPLTLEDESKGIRNEFHIGESHQELGEDLLTHIGQEVLLGLEDYNHWLSDNIQEFAAYVPMPNGRVVLGAY